MEVGNISPLSANVINLDKIRLNENYKALSKISESLVYLRKAFDGDMDCLLIYLIILLDDLSSTSLREARVKAGVSGLSISEITGIARETVRRKIGFLVANGMVRRERNSHYHVEDRSSVSFMGLESLEMVVAMLLPVQSN